MFLQNFLKRVANHLEMTNDGVDRHLAQLPEMMAHTREDRRQTIHDVAKVYRMGRIAAKFVPLLSNAH